jgi:hypothetical protein
LWRPHRDRLVLPDERCVLIFIITRGECICGAVYTITVKIIEHEALRTPIIPCAANIDVGDFAVRIRRSIHIYAELNESVNVLWR